jgi:hypothetical protein
MYTLDQQFFREKKKRTSLCPAGGGWETENSNLSGFGKVDKFYLDN